MKKISIILAIVLCASVFFCVPVSATGEEVRLYVKASGTEVTAWVKTSDAVAVGAIQGTIKYEESDFDYDSAIANSGIAANNATASSFADVDGATKFALVGNPSTGTSGEWATLTYGTDEGTAMDFSLAGVKAFAVAGDSLAVTSKVIWPGDLNEDKTVNILDYVRYKLIRLSEVSTPTVSENMDVDMDGNYDNNNETWISADYQDLRNDILGY